MPDSLLERLREVVLSGEFTSSAGRPLKKYIDIKSALLTGSLALEIVQSFGTLIPPETTKIVGKGLGAAALMGGLCFFYGLNGARTLDEKEMALYGVDRNILGHIPTAEDNVFVVDDVCLTGKSLRAAREIIRPTGARVVRYAVVAKRGEPIPALDAPLSYLFTEADFGIN